MENEKKNFIVDHALLSEENFLLATQVANSFEHIAGRLVNELLGNLAKELTGILGPEWETKTSFAEDNAFETWYFEIYKKKWLLDGKAMYRFGLQSDRKELGDFYLYAAGSADIMITVNKLLNEQYKKGRKGSSGGWYQYVDRDYLNWTSDETLVKLYRQKELLQYLVVFHPSKKCSTELIGNITNELRIALAKEVPTHAMIFRRMEQ